MWTGSPPVEPNGPYCPVFEKNVRESILLGEKGNPSQVLQTSFQSVVLKIARLIETRVRPLPCICLTNPTCYLDLLLSLSLSSAVSLWLFEYSLMSLGRASGTF